MTLGYQRGIRLWAGDLDWERRVRGFNRLSYEELQKTNYWSIFPRGNKTLDLELVAS